MFEMKDMLNKKINMMSILCLNVSAIIQKI